MTNAISRAIEQHLASHSFGELTTTTSIVAVLLLILVTAEREILRATRHDTSRRDLVAFTVVVIPMLVVFVTVILARFMHLS